MSEEKNIHCSFCGRSKNEAEMMIAGVDAHICDRCVEQAGGILHTELGEAPQTSPLGLTTFWLKKRNHPVRREAQHLIIH